MADGENLDIWIYDVARHTLNPLTSNGKSFAPIWAPDGKQVVFTFEGTGKFQPFRQSTDGSGEPELLAEASGQHTSCSPDGNELLMGAVDIWVLPLEGREKHQPRPFIQREHIQREGVWSPDGRWVAYSSNESRWWEVYVEPYPGPGPKVRISTEGGFQPVWSRDGKELFYLSGDKMMAVTIETEPEFTVTGSEVLFEGQYLMLGVRHSYDVAPDGRFLMIQESEELTPPCIHVVLNWFEELKRLVPPGRFSTGRKRR
jgi:Tol biopolymer transport system component